MERARGYRFRIEPQIAQLRFRAVATVASAIEDRLYVTGKIDTVLRVQRSQRKEIQGPTHHP
jgi:hypothetical protein